MLPVCFPVLQVIEGGWWNWEQDLLEEGKVLMPSQAGTAGSLEPQIWEDLGFRDLALPTLGQNRQ